MRNNDLTPKEKEVLAMLQTGLSNAEIAKKFWLSEQTIKFHLSNIYRKLGVSSRLEAIRWAEARAAQSSDEAIQLLHLWFERYRGFVSGTPQDMVVRTRKLLEECGVELLDRPAQ